MRTAGGVPEWALKAIGSASMFVPSALTSYIIGLQLPGRLHYRRDVYGCSLQGKTRPSRALNYHRLKQCLCVVWPIGQI